MLTLTTTEVAAFTGLDEKSIRKDVEYGIARTGSPPRFSDGDVLYFAARASFVFKLARRERRSLYDSILEATRARRPCLDLGPGWTLDLAALEERLTSELSRFRDWQGSLVSDPEILAGETVFPNSRLSVRHVGDMVRRGVDHREIMEDYPYLSDEDLRFARLFAIAYPRIGRPRS